MNAIRPKRYILISFLILLAGILLFPITAGAQAFWHDSKPIEINTGFEASQPRVVMSGLNAVAVWCQSDGNNNRVYSNYSTDGGDNWHDARLIENNAGHSAMHPELAMSGSTVVAIWQQLDINQNYRINVNYSLNSGMTWNNAQLIDNAGKDGSRPQVAVYGMKVVAVWGQTDQFNNYRVGCNFSTNGGHDWSSARLIDNAGHDGYLPRVAMYGSQTVAVWNQDYMDDERICSIYSGDGGANWHGVQYIDQNGGNNFTGPTIAMYEQNVIIVWDQVDGSLQRIYANQSKNGGITWNTARLIDNPASGGISPVVGMYGSNVVALWNQYDGSNYRICSSHSRNGGDIWSETWLFNSPGHDGYSPCIAFAGSNAIAVWKDNNGIRSRYSATGGNYWEAIQTVDDAEGTGGSSPRVAAAGSNAVAVWEAADTDITRLIYSNFGTLGTSTMVPGISVVGLALLVVSFSSLIFLILHLRRFRRILQ
jgi:hypothetical protein